MNKDLDLLDKKVDELIYLLDHTDIDSIKANNYRNRILRSIHNSSQNKAKIGPFLSFSKDENLSREELLEGMGKLLQEHNMDSKISRVYLRHQLLKKIVLSMIGLVLIVTGFSMIILPAPDSFEMFTIFYFNHDDGVTLMDLISMLIVLCGVFLFITSFTKKSDFRDID